MTASQILERKGYDNAQINDMIYSVGLDLRVREKFGITGEPIHLWEAYELGDADEEELNEKAENLGYGDYHELLKSMDNELIELCEAYPDNPKPYTRD